MYNREASPYILSLNVGRLRVSPNRFMEVCMLCENSESDINIPKARKNKHESCFHGMYDKMRVFGNRLSIRQPKVRKFLFAGRHLSRYSISWIRRSHREIFEIEMSPCGQNSVTTCATSKPFVQITKTSRWKLS
jgi:hypothetical protein